MEDLYKVGEAGSVVKVKDGYARNFLLPQKKAVLANKDNLNRVNSIKKKAKEIRIRVMDELNKSANILNGKVLEFVMKSDEKGHLYGSVSEVEIAKELHLQYGIQIKRKIINLPIKIKTVGEFKADLIFSAEVKVEIKIVVKSEQPEVLEETPKEEESPKDTITEV